MGKVMSNLTLAKQLYHLQWRGTGDHPCSEFVVAESVTQAIEMVKRDMQKKKLSCENLGVTCICLVDRFEIKPTESNMVQTRVDEQGCKMPYCECGYGLCFDDVFCGKCGSRLNWERFWNYE